jgi:FMN reductase
MTSSTNDVRRIVVIQAGTGQPSSTRLLADRLAGATRDAALERGVDSTVEVIDLRDHAQALAGAVLTGFATGALREALEFVEQADAVIAVTPIYQASYSGLFKSFIDVLDEGAVRGTPVLMGATAGTARHSLVLEHAMRPLFAYLKAITVPTAVFAASEDWGAIGGTGDAGASSGLDRRITVAASELADLVAGRTGSRTRTDDFTVPAGFEELLRGA